MTHWRCAMQQRPSLVLTSCQVLIAYRREGAARTGGRQSPDPDDSGSGHGCLSRHALEELGKDDLTTVDAVNALRGGVVEPGELERGAWRYRVRTARLVVVVAFRSDTELVVVTGWRVGRR